MELDLRDLIRIVWRRRWLVAALIFAAGLASYTASRLMPRVYEARSKILIIDPKSSGLSILNEISGMPKNQVANYVEILKSRSLLLDVADRLGLPRDQESLRRTQESLTVQPIPGTDAIELRVQHTDRRLAQRLANTYVKCFMRRSLADNQADARQAREFIEEQLAVVSSRLARAEAALSGYQRASRLVSPSDETRQYVDKLAQFEARRAENDVALAQAQARLAKVEQFLSREEQTMISAKVLARNPA
ncbi:MAG: GumC family protein, partial [Bacteroidota bacterium]